MLQLNGENSFTTVIEQGPSIYEMRNVEGEEYLQPFTCEFLIDKSAISLDTEKFEEGEFENKIGGTPYFLQFEEYPNDEKENWNLLLQLDSASIPFHLNFGDTGVGYAFISKDGKRGRFLWQCL